MKNKKVITVLFLSLALLLSSAIPAFAGTTAPSFSKTWTYYVAYQTSQYGSIYYASDHKIVFTTQESGYWISCDYPGEYYTKSTYGGTTYSDTVTSFSTLGGPSNSYFSIISANYDISDTSNNILYDAPAQQATSSTEYLYITLPREGYQSVSKVISYWVAYNIEASSVDDININVTNPDGSSLSSDPDVDGLSTTNNECNVSGGYATGSFKVNVQYDSSFTGSCGIKVYVQSDSANKFLEVIRNVSVIAFTDSNADGLDDLTGEETYHPPTTPLGQEFPTQIDQFNILDSSTWLNPIINMIEAIQDFLAPVSQAVSSIFGFLPPSINAAILFAIGLGIFLRILGR
jgi:hypothetical protein